MWLTIDPGLRTGSSLHPSDPLHPWCSSAAFAIIGLIRLLESAIIQMKTGHHPRTELWFCLSVFSILICTKSDAVQFLSAALPQLTCVQLPSLYSTENEWQRAAHSETFAVMWVERNADSGEGDVLPPPPPPPPTTTHHPPPALAIIAQCNVRPAVFPWKRSPA